MNDISLSISVLFGSEEIEETGVPLIPTELGTVLAGSGCSVAVAVTAGLPVEKTPEL